MSEFKGTPGPWVATDWNIDDGPNPITICKAEKENLPAGRTSIWPNGIVFKQIANCEDSSFSDEESIDNARLIAAAPCLLEALQAMTRAFAPFPREDTEGWREEHEAYQEAHAAIAKALGQ